MLVVEFGVLVPVIMKELIILLPHLLGYLKFKFMFGVAGQEDPIAVIPGNHLWFICWLQYGFSNVTKWFSWGRNIYFLHNDGVDICLAFLSHSHGLFIFILTWSWMILYLAPWWGSSGAYLHGFMQRWGFRWDLFDQEQVSCKIWLLHTVSSESYIYTCIYVFTWILGSDLLISYY